MSQACEPGSFCDTLESVLTNRRRTGVFKVTMIQPPRIGEKHIVARAKLDGVAQFFEFCPFCGRSLAYKAAP